MSNSFPVLQVVGYRNSGKTILVTKIISYLMGRYGLKIVSLKHDAHEFSLDKEGKDTWRHREAGAVLSMIQSPTGLGLTMVQKQERSLNQLVQLVHQLGSYDMIIVEGFKRESYPKIVLIRNQRDFDLIVELQKIEILVFCRNKDYQLYQQGIERGTWPRYLSFEREDEDQIQAWIEVYWLHHKGGKE